MAMKMKIIFHHGKKMMVIMDFYHVLLKQLSPILSGVYVHHMIQVH